MVPWPKAPISTNHFGAFFAKSYLFGYKGTHQYVELVRAANTAFEGAFLTRTPAFKTSLLCNRVITMLHEVYRSGAKPDDPLLRKAEQTARAG